MKVSVIIPLYNAAQYIGMCLESIKTQTFADFECIIVNDGSKDDSVQCAVKTIADDSRFCVYDKANEGVSRALLYGLEKATGEYVAFFDSDDIVEKNMLECLLNVAERDNADIVCCGYREITPDKTTLCQVPLATGVYNRQKIRQEIIPVFFNMGRGLYFDRAMYASRWNKIFRRSLLNEITEYFDSLLTYGEDLLLNAAATFKAETISIVAEECLYNYYIRQGTACNSYIKNLDVQIHRLYERGCQLFRENDLEAYMDGFYRDIFCFVIKRMENVVKFGEDKARKLKDIQAMLDDELTRKTLPYAKKCRISFKDKMKYFLVKHKMKHLIYLCLK